MKVCGQRFNIYFTLALILAFFCGCQTDKDPNKDKVAALRIHIESNPNDVSTTQNISLLRSDPVMVNIAKEPVLTEANIIAARMIDSPGGFALEIQFDESGAIPLEPFSASNHGKHLVIFGEWGNREKLVNSRWLAAPLITRRISDGTLSFTPDASKQEMYQIVICLNNVVKKIAKGKFK